jgi:hypothetical protein
VSTEEILGEMIMAFPMSVRCPQTLHRRPAIQLDGIRRRHGGRALGVVGIMQELRRARSSTASNHRPAFVGEPWQWWMWRLWMTLMMASQPNSGVSSSATKQPSGRR